MGIEITVVKTMRSSFLMMDRLRLFEFDVHLVKTSGGHVSVGIRRGKDSYDEIYSDIIGNECGYGQLTVNKVSYPKIYLTLMETYSKLVLSRLLNIVLEHDIDVDLIEFLVAKDDMDRRVILLY